jgi:5-oxopent-3-ene-1,2,5-tricarboxylate decarboxylase/2-hydroxyhepta-2,4-diene-1,7-dioate isomerase
MRTVVGAALNFHGAWQAAEAMMREVPHFKPPTHAVLYLKPANTWCGPGDEIVLPAGVDEVEVGATLGVVIGTPAARVREHVALQHVAGYRVVNDVTVPHASLLRPPLAQKCRDNFCPMSEVVPVQRVPDAGALEIRAFVDGKLEANSHTRELIRSVSALLAEITEFMTLWPGDVLLMGVPHGMPRARAGQQLAVEIEGVGRIENRIRSGAAA